MNFFSAVNKVSSIVLYPLGGWKPSRKDFRPKTMCGLFWYSLTAFLFLVYGLIALYIVPDLTYSLFNDTVFDGELAKWGYSESYELSNLMIWLLLPSVIMALLVSLAILIAPPLAAVVGTLIGLLFLGVIVKDKLKERKENGKTTPVEQFVGGAACGIKSMFSKIKCKWYVNYED